MKKGGGGGGGGERAVAKGGGEEGVGEGVAVERETGRQTTASRRGRRGQHTCITLAAPSRSQKKHRAHRRPLSVYARGRVHFFKAGSLYIDARGRCIY